MLSGEPGIGKSRLIAALSEHPATQPHTRLRYFCSPQHTDSPQYPDIVCISAGRDGAPVRGSGVFVGGAGDTGGRVLLRRLESGTICSDCGIAQGTPDSISGGVFVVYGAAADLVRNRGPVTTYGANDMVLDNWGTVDRWIAEEKITSHGPSGMAL